MMRARAQNWKFHGTPGRYTDPYGSSYYVMAYDLFNRKGYYSLYDEKENETLYCCMDSNDTVFTLTAHGKSGNIKMDAKRVVHNYYQSDGEAIILENDIIEYK